MFGLNNYFHKYVTAGKICAPLGHTV